MVPEKWGKIGTGEDPETGLPMVFVARIKYDVRERLTVWKLVKRAKGWYSVSQWNSNGRWRRFPERNGVPLSDSRIDRLLRIYGDS